MLSNEVILIPVVGLMLLTFVVWCYLWLLRLGYMVRHKVSVEQLSNSAQLALLPVWIGRPKENLKSLCELPVIFYALCGVIYSSYSVDVLYFKLALMFFVLRLGHSLVDCRGYSAGLNFLFYMSSSLVLWVMLGRFSYQLLG